MTLPNGQFTADRLCVAAAATTDGSPAAPAPAPESLTTTVPATDSGEPAGTTTPPDKQAEPTRQASTTTSVEPTAPEQAPTPATPKYSTFRVSVSDHVATLEFANPKRSNALGMEFWKEFPQALRELAGSNVRALVICGEGDHFCAGIDLSLFRKTEFLDTKSPEAKQRLQDVITGMQDALTAIETAPFPVIAAIHGACLGAGLDLAAACDFRYASQNAVFSIEEINIGIMPDLGSLQRLPLIMPVGLVREMAFTGVRIDSARALSSGLVNAVHANKEELLNAAAQTCRVIGDKSAKAVSATKLSLNYGLDHGVREALRLTAALQVQVIDPSEILAALAKKRTSK